MYRTGFNTIFRVAVLCFLLLYARAGAHSNKTVNDAGTPAITATALTGAISACAGTASSGEGIAQFAVSGSNLTDIVIASASSGFEISSNKAGGFGNTVTMYPVNGLINSHIIYVRSAASASAGQITGSAQLTSTGATTISVALSGYVSPLPVVLQPGNQSVANGQNTAAVNFSGQANSFSWTNDTPTIGLAASGTGNIASFKGFNAGTTPVTATITVTPKNNKYIYVADSQAGTVTVYDPAGVAIVARIPVGASPEGIAVSPDGSHVYVANYNDATVSVIDASTNTVIKTVAVGNQCARVLASADGRFVYVANYTSNTVSVINTATYTVSATIPVGNGPQDMVFSPDQSKLYVTNYFDSNISVINIATNVVVGTLNCDVYPHGIAISPDGSQLYVTQQNAAKVSVINITGNYITAAIAVGSTPGAIVMSADGSTAYVANSNTTTVSVINTATNTVIATPAAGTRPTGLSLSGDGSILYVQDFQKGSISQINTANNQLIGAIEIGAGADSFGNFITPGLDCPGGQVTFTITITPATTSLPTYNISAVSGYISACQGTASASPNIESFTAAAHNVTGNITATAPAGFEISLSSNSGYGNSVTLVQSGGTVNQQTIYIRSAATDPVGKIQGNVTFSSTPGVTDVQIPVNGTVNTIPTVVASPVTQEVASGTFTTALNFTGSGNTFNWTNDTPSIGLAASGTGNIPSFPAINKGSGKVTATITVVPEAIGYAYITNQQANTVSVINTFDNTIVKTINVGAFPTGVAVSPDGTKAYVTNQRDNTISVINTATNAVISTFTLQNSSPTGIAVSPDGKNLYVVNLNSNSLSVVDASTGSIISSYAVGGYPVGVAVTPDGTKVFVTNSSNSISMIDLTKGQVNTINTANGPYDACTSPDGKLLYVTNSGANTVSVINVSTSAIIGSIPVGNSPEGITISPDGSTLYVANANSNNVSVINAVTNKVTATIPAGLLPSGISVTSDGQYIYVTNQNSNSVSEINTGSDAVVATIPVGAYPKSLGNFITPGSGCPGNPANFTITVDPQSLAPGITASSMTGNITACEGSPSVTVGQINVSGSGLSGNITALAPSGFEVSLSAAGGFGNTITIAQTGGSVNNVPVYIRSSAAASTGKITGNVDLSSPNLTDVLAPVAATVSIAPVLSPTPPSQEKVAGQLSDPVNFTGSASVFSWTNNNPSIGLAPSGTGDIAAFTTLNPGSTEVTATVTVIPQLIAYAYIANQASNTVSVINTQNNTIVATIPVGKQPIGATISPDGTRAYITNQGENTVSVINTQTNKEVSRVWLNYTSSLIGVTASPDGKAVYTAGQGSVSGFYTSTGNPFASYNVTGQCGGIVVSPDNTRLFVTLTNNAQVIDVINLLSGNIGTLTVGKGAYGICSNNDGSVLYVTNSTDNTVSVINVVTSATIATIPVGTTPQGIALSPDGKTIYVANAGSGNVSVINTSTNAVTSSIAVGNHPYGISVTSDGQSVYVTNQGSNSVSVINAATNAVGPAITVGSSPASLGNFISPVTECPGAPATFTIKVKPASAGFLSADAVSGYITACQGTVSVSPDIESFHVSGIGLTDNITATAPSGFEVSLDPNTGYSNSIIITQSGGSVTNVPVYVRSSSNAPSGILNGNVILSSTGEISYNEAVTATVNIVPTVTAQALTQEISTGTSTAPINFTGTGDIVSWTNDTPSIGLASSGTGDIAAFTAVNNTVNKITATITATPQRVGYAYITNQSDNTVTVINTVTNAVVTTTDVNFDPTGVAVSPDGKKVYITNPGNGVISFINPYNNTQYLSDGTIEFTAQPMGITVSLDDTKLYVSEMATGRVEVIGTDNGEQVVSPYEVGGSPMGVTLSPDGNKLYVANTTAGMKVVDIGTADISPLNVPIGTYASCISPDGRILYVTVPGSNSVSVLNVITNSVIATIAVGQNPEGINISPDGSRVYVANNSSGTVSVINTATNKVVATVGVGKGPLGVCATGDGSSVYVTNNTSNTVSVINAVSNTVTATIPVGHSPASLGNFILSGSACPGQPSTFTITVDPKIAPVITASGIRGNIAACVGSPSADPNIGQMTVSGIDLKSGVTVTAPDGFEVSINPTVGYESNAFLQDGQDGTLSSVIVYIRAKASGTAGTISGNLTLSSNSANSVSIPVSGVIKALAEVDKVANQTIANGNMTAAVNFTGTGATFNWTNDNIVTGLPASGTGNIAPFTAVNNTNTAIASKITVVPQPPALTGFAYIASSLGNNVAAIDLETNKVTANISVGHKPYALAVSPDGGSVYVTNYDDGTVSVINTSNQTVQKNIRVGNTPYGIAVSPDGTHIYVANEGDQTISVINTADYTVATVPVAGLPTEVIVSPDSKKVYITGYNKNQIYVFDTSTNTLLSTITTIGAPFNLEISPDGSKLFYLNSDSFCVVNTATGTISSSLQVGAGPLGMAVSPDGKTVYVSVDGANNVAFVDVAGNKVTSTINIGKGPGGISITPDGNYLYATNETDATVSVVDIKTLKVVNTVAVGGAPVSLGRFIEGNTLKCEGVPITFTITVEPSSNAVATQSILIPNTFTPNGDGINDTWEIKSLENYPNCTVAIYNRWGEKLYSSIGYPIPWDGTYKGANLPVGTYYYIINLKKGVNAISGWVAIVK